MTEVPTISLAAFYAAVEARGGVLPTPEDVSAGAPDSGLCRVVSAVNRACEEVGFFVVIDHGVDQELLAAQRRECAAFFERPPQTLITSMVNLEASRFMWLDYVPSVRGAASDGGSWSLGPVADRGSLPWPLDSEALRTTWLAYYAALEGLVATLMRVFALALGLPAATFDAALAGRHSALRAIRYAEVPEEDLAAAGGEVVRSREHTDWGCVTVLLPDAQVGGLEIRTKAGAWLPLQPMAGGLVVNLGDLLPEWTGGRWVGTPHRVVARHATRGPRLSMPYFGLVNRETVLRPLVTPVSAQPEEAWITAGEFFDKHAPERAKQYTQRALGEKTLTVTAPGVEDVAGVG